MRNKIAFRLIALFLALTLIAAFAAGCTGKKDKSVKSIEITAGSFKSDYALDERPDYSNAKLRVTYTDGSVEYVGITADMVTGLDTSRTTLNGVITVTYKGATDQFLYRVISGEGVRTSFRLAARVEGTGSTRTLTVSAGGVSEVAEGVYAVAFTLAATGGATLSPEVSLKYTGNWRISAGVNSATSVKVVLYSASGAEALSGDADLIEISVTLSGSTGTVNIQSATMSNGIEDFTVPATSINIK